MSLWSNEDIFKLIQLFKAKPVLWNPQHSHHKVKKKIREAWVTISNEMGISVVDLKRKRDSLMASFRHVVKKQKDAMIASNGQSFRKKPVWIFYDAMNSFLGDLYDTSYQPDTQQMEHHVQYKEESARQHKFSPCNTRSLKRDSPDEPYDPEKRTKYPFKNLVDKPSNELNEVDDECELYGRLLVSKLKRFPESERQDIMLAIDGFIIDHSRSVRNRAQGQSSSAYASVSSSSSSHSHMQIATRPIISIPEVFSAPEPICVVQIPKLERERMVFTANSCDPLNTSHDEIFNNSDGE